MANNFICPEVSKIDNKTAIFNYLYVMSDVFLGETYVDEYGNVYQYVQEIKSSTDEIYTYVPQDILELFTQTKVYSYEPTTLANIVSNFNDIDITLNPSTMFSNQEFIWNLNSLSQLSSPMFLTIFTDEGIICSLPRKRTNANFLGKITNNEIIKESDMKLTLDGWDGSEYSTMLSNKNHSVVLTTYEQEHLNAMTCKRIAMSNLISFYIGDEIGVEPLDYVEYEGELYVIVSKRLDENNQVFYEAVLENDEDTVTSSDDVEVYDSLNALNANNLKGSSVSYYTETSNGVTQLDFEIEVNKNELLIIDMNLKHASGSNDIVYLYETNYSTTNSDYYYVEHVARSNGNHVINYSATPNIFQQVKGKESSMRIYITVTPAGELYAKTYQLAKKIGGDTDIELRWHGVTSDGSLPNNKIDDLRFKWSLGQGIDADSTFRFEVRNLEEPT